VCQRGFLSGSCNDGNSCTTNELCLNGNCTGGSSEFCNDNVICTSSEPDDAAGPSDGHTVNDIQGAELGTADFNFQLRAEADKSGPGRLYTVVYTATDSSGRQVVGSAGILAPVKGGGPAQTPVGVGTGRKAKPR
jgi:hypothetical protein